MKKCEYFPSAEYPAVIITAPAINLPRPSVTPDAVRNSVSMFSLITGARAGIIFLNSPSDASRQPAAAALVKKNVETNNTADKRRQRSEFIRVNLRLIFNCSCKAPPRQVGARNVKVSPGQMHRLNYFRVAAVLLLLAAARTPALDPNRNL